MTKAVDFKAYLVTPRKDKEDFWNGIGGAFKFKTEDGREGIRVPTLNLVIIEPKAGEENQEPQSENTETDGRAA
ncbi:MAG: hypothetical protein CMH27_07245 [Micavibrio sp.]|nr:hypothetical protein [Micavibrio sp.]|tara:strand:+ start:5105 stop:5326 length:222 start_codon:yes stop_codon:yes gene_type:complete